MRKRYSAKVYSLAGAFIRTLDASILMNEPTFTSKIAGGQGQCVLQLSIKIDEFLASGVIDYMNVIKILEYDDVFNIGEPTVIYTGYVSQYEPYVQGGQEGVNVVLIGLFSLLTLGMYKSGSSYAFNKTDDPGNVIKNIIDNFALTYTGGWLSYSGGHVSSVGTNMNYDFNETTWAEAIKTTAGFGGPDWWWYVDETGQVRFGDRPATPTHLLTLGKDVESLRVTRNPEKVINKYRLKWGVGPTVTTFEDVTSQGTYGVREPKPETDSNVKNLTSANLKGNKVIADNKDAKITTTLVVNNEYNIESIKPGHTVSVRNIGDSSLLPDNMLVTSVAYQSSKITLTLEDQTANFADTFAAAVDAV